MSQEIEEQIAHLTRTVDELSDVIARQEREIERLARRVGLLLAAMRPSMPTSATDAGDGPDASSAVLACAPI